jgi:hypothetical protein
MMTRQERLYTIGIAWWGVCLLVLVFVLTACGGRGEEPPDAESLVDVTGCDRLIEEQTEEVFVREMFICPGYPEPTTVYTFNNTDGRDNWLEVAETFGVVVIAEGDDWLHVE